MDSKAISSKSVIGLIITTAFLVARTVSAKSIPGLSGTCMSPISPSSLYPGTTTLALHPMSATPYSDGSNPDASDCPETPTVVHQSDPISVRSTCPFEYITNFDRNRIPASIREARCLCGGCLDPYTGVQSADLTCQEVRYPMQVLRKSTTSPINGFEMYSLTTEDITVGCACPRFVL